MTAPVPGNMRAIGAALHTLNTLFESHRAKAVEWEKNSSTQLEDLRQRTGQIKELLDSVGALNDRLDGIRGENRTELDIASERLDILEDGDVERMGMTQVSETLVKLENTLSNICPSTVNSERGGSGDENMNNNRIQAICKTMDAHSLAITEIENILSSMSNNSRIRNEQENANLEKFSDEVLGFKKLFQEQVESITNRMQKLEDENEVQIVEPPASKRKKHGHEPDDRRFAIIRSFLRTSLDNKIRRVIAKKGGVKTVQDVFRTQTARTYGACCSIETCLGMFRSITTVDGERAQIIPDTGALKYEGASERMWIGLAFATYADICAFLAISKPERIGCSIQSNQVAQRGSPYSHITGRELLIKDKQGRLVRYLFVGRTGMFGCKENEKIIVALEDSVDNVATTAPEGFVLKEIQRDQVHILGHLNSCKYVLKWTRTSRVGLDKDTALHQIMGILTIEIPVLSTAGEKTAVQILEAISRNQLGLSSIETSPFDVGTTEKTK